MGTVVSRVRAGGRSELGSALSGGWCLSRSAIAYSLCAGEESTVSTIVQLVGKGVLLRPEFEMSRHTWVHCWVYTWLLVTTFLVNCHVSRCIFLCFVSKVCRDRHKGLPPI